MEKLKDLNLFITPNGDIFRKRKMLSSTGGIIDLPPQKIPTHILNNRKVLFNNKRRHDVANLVAEHYLPNPENLKVARYLDGDPENTHPDNLYWKPWHAGKAIYVYHIPMHLRPRRKTSHRSSQDAPQSIITPEGTLTPTPGKENVVHRLKILHSGTRDAVKLFDAPASTIMNRLKSPTRKGFVRGYYITHDPDLASVTELFAPPEKVFAYEIDDDNLTGFRLTAYNSIEEAVNDPSVDANARNIDRCVHSRYGVAGKRFWSYERLTTEQLLSALNQCSVYVYSWPELKLMDAYMSVAQGARDKAVSLNHIYNTYRDRMKLAGKLFWSENMLVPSEKEDIKLLMQGRMKRYAQGIYGYTYPDYEQVTGPHKDIRETAAAMGLAYGQVQRCLSATCKSCVHPTTLKRYTFTYGERT